MHFRAGRPHNAIAWAHGLKKKKKKKILKHLISIYSLYKMEKLVCVYDFTIPNDKIDLEELKDKLNNYCKQWTFQLEKGESGYEHYQGRISLKIRSRINKVIKDFDNKNFHFSITCTQNKGNDFYVVKQDTRIGGPWSDKDKEIYIPRQFRDIILKPWQQHCIDISKEFNTRDINIIYDPDGNNGKSTLACICELKYNGFMLPVCNDQEKLIQSMADYCIAKQVRDVNPVFIDLPRAFDKNKLYGIYSAIEQIKNGKLVDMRYNYKEWWIDSPCIFVFTNREPDQNLLSRDRWKIWTIQEDNLIPYEEGEIF